MSKRDVRAPYDSNEHGYFDNNPDWDIDQYADTQRHPNNNPNRDVDQYADTQRYPDYNAD